MASKAKPLNDELKNQFYPWVESKGFERQKPADPHFVEFRRRSSNGVDIFEIQWDKYWRPYFVINFDKEHPDGSMWPSGGRLQRKRGAPLTCWFGLSKPLINKLSTCQWSYQPYEVVQELQRAFAELEIWWENGEIGSHIYFSEYHA